MPFVSGSQNVAIKKYTMVKHPSTKNIVSKLVAATHVGKMDAIDADTAWFNIIPIAMPFALILVGISSDRASQTHTPGPTAKPATNKKKNIVIIIPEAVPTSNNPLFKSKNIIATPNCPITTVPVPSLSRNFRPFLSTKNAASKVTKKLTNFIARSLQLANSPCIPEA